MKKIIQRFKHGLPNNNHKNIDSVIKWFLFGQLSPIYEYGLCNRTEARRNIIHGNVQFICRIEVYQDKIDGVDHIHHIWVDFDRTHWKNFYTYKEITNGKSTNNK